MTDRLMIVIFWFFSIAVSFIPIIQTKGNDWYAPVTNKQKMFMTIINASIFFMVVVLMHEALLFDLGKTVLVSIGVVIIILFFITPSDKDIKSLFSKKNSQQPSSQQGGNQPMNTPDPKNDRNTLKEYLQKFLTFFNSTFFALNAIYTFYIIETEGNITTYSEILTRLESQIISTTVLFWFTIIGTVITSNDWKYNEEVAERIPKTIIKDVNYFIRKITRRNR